MTTYPTGYPPDVQFVGFEELKAAVLGFGDSMRKLTVAFQPLVDLAWRRHAIERLDIPESDIKRIDYPAGKPPVLVMHNWRRVPLTTGGTR